MFGIALAAGPVGAIIVGIPFGLAFIAAALVVGGATGAYFSTYWTLAFRRMELDLPPPAAPGPPPAYPAPPSA